MSVFPSEIEGFVSGVFEYRDGALYVEECAVADLAARYGTPVHVISEAALRRRARELRAAFAEQWPTGEVVVLPAVKANPIVALHRVLAQEGCGADLFGAGELEVAVRAGIDPRRISVNGNAKDLATIRRAVELGARITLDSVREIELTRQAAVAVGRRAEVRIRVRPLVDLELGSEPYGGLPIRLAYGRYKPGIPWDDLDAAGRALAAPELDLTGVHMHFGRHTTDLDAIGVVIDRYAALIGELSRRWDGWTPQTIDVGGGIAHDADPHGLAGPEPRPPRRIPTIREYAATICGRLRAGLAKEGIDPAGRTLEIEPGRSLFGPCGIHLARVLHVKRQTVPFPHAWVEVDSSQAFLPDVVLQRSRHPVVLAGPAAGVAEPFDVVGVACTSDVLAHGEPLPPLEPGAVVAFGLTGAYQDAAATNFNVLPRPATVLVRGAESYVIRKAERVDDVLARDVVPAHLRAVPDAPDRAASPTGVDHVGLTCADLDRAVHFFHEALGLELRGRGESQVLAAGPTGDGYAWADFELSDGRVIELIEFADKKLDPIPPGTVRPGSSHLGVRVDDLHGTLARLAAHGVEPLSPPRQITNPGAWHGAVIAYVRDPDGHAVELVQHAAIGASS